MGSILTGTKLRNNDQSELAVITGKGNKIKHVLNWQQELLAEKFSTRLHDIRTRNWFIFLDVCHGLDADATTTTSTGTTTTSTTAAIWFI